MIRKVIGCKQLAIIVICLVLIGNNPVMVAAEAVTGNTANDLELVLTIEDAQNRAIAKNNNIKMAEYSIEQDEISNEDAADDVKYIPADGSNSDATSTYLKAVQSNLSLQTTRKEKEASIDSVKKNVFQKYTNVLTAQEKVKLAELSLKYADFQRLAARVGYQVGKESLSSQNTAERNYIAKELALAKSKNSLEDSWRSFNNLLDLDVKARPVLKDDPQFSAYEFDDLELEVLRNMDINPDVWKADQQVAQAQLSLNLHAWSSASDKYEVKKLTVDKAILSASNTKEQVRDSIISSYNSIFNLEQQYQGALQDILTAEENLNTAKLKFEMGTGSKGDILKAENDLASLQQTLKSTAYEHELAEMTFEKPWVN